MQLPITFAKRTDSDGKEFTVARISACKEFPEGATFVFGASNYNGKRSINGGLSAGYDSEVKVGRIALYKIRISCEQYGTTAGRVWGSPTVYASRPDKKNAPYSRGYDDPTDSQRRILYTLAGMVRDHMAEDAEAWAYADMRERERVVAEAEKAVEKAEAELAAARAKLAELEGATA